MAPVKPVPLTVTALVPPAGPLVGLTAVTVGGGVIGVVVARRSVAEVPLAVVTVTFTVPVPDGAVDRERAPPPATLTEVPGFEVPKSTAVAPVKPVPLTVTVLVPPAGPLVGLTEVTVGGLL